MAFRRIPGWAKACGRAAAWLSAVVTACLLSAAAVFFGQSYVRVPLLPWWVRNAALLALFAGGAWISRRAWPGFNRIQRGAVAFLLAATLLCPIIALERIYSHRSAQREARQFAIEIEPSLSKGEFAAALQVASRYPRNRLVRLIARGIEEARRGDGQACRDSAGLRERLAAGLPRDGENQDSLLGWFLALIYGLPGLGLFAAFSGPLARLRRCSGDASRARPRAGVSLVPASTRCCTFSPRARAGHRSSNPTGALGSWTSPVCGSRAVSLSPTRRRPERGI